MKLLSLGLEKYGAYSERRLNFRPDARVHVVFGPNEAGKSTALAAVGDLLFGFPERTNADFLHKASDLRVAGELAGRDRARLSFVRRKGRVRTLATLEGELLPDDALAPFLGAITRDIFSRAFGLNAQSLRDGARELLESRGETGAALTVAASGLRGLGELRKQLSEEAGQIYSKTRAKGRSFYQAMDRYDHAQKSKRDHELRADVWRALEDEIASGEQRLVEIKAARRDILARQERLKRLSRLRGPLRVLDEADAALRGLNESSDLPTGFGAELGKALDEVAASEAANAEALAKAQAALEELAQIKVDDAILARSRDISGAFSDTGDYRSSANDRPNIQERANAAKAKALDLARGLGLADLSDLSAGAPTDAAIAEVVALAKERDQIEAEQRSLDDRSARENKEIADIDRLIAGRGAPIDPAQFREQFRIFSDAPARAAERDREAAQLANDERSLAEEAARLTPPVRDIATLARVAIPDRATIQKFVADYERARNETRDARKELAAARGAATRASEALERFARDRPLPTPERIEAARRARDAQWTKLRATLFAEPDGLAGAPLAEAVARFETDSIESDRLADEAVHEAGRLADYRTQQQECAAARKEEEAATAELARVDAARGALAQGWRDLWTGVGVEPASPAEMLAWTGSVDRLLQRREKILERQTLLEARTRDIAALAGPLDQLRAQIGLSALPGVSVAAAVQRIDARLADLDSAWNEARDARTRREAAVARKQELAPGFDTLAARLATWQDRWREAMPAVGLRAGSTREGALAAIDIWRKAPAVLSEFHQHIRRVNDMTTKMEAFEATVGALVGELAPDLADQSAHEAIGRLQERLNAARGAKVRRDEQTRNCDALRKTAARAAEALAQAQSRLAALADRAPGEAELPALRARLVTRDAAIDRLNAARREFALVADGRSEEAARAEVAAFDPASADIDADELRREEERLADEDRQIYAETDRAKRRREELSRGVGAEAAEQQRQAAAAEMRDLARQWAVLRIGETLLGAALENQRARRADPLLARAGAIFSTLTGGGFAAIEQHADDADNPVLMARRAGGATLGVEALSEGARDQMFLALRLAYVEEYASHSEPAPFIADDIFTSFDDARTGHALRALGEAGAITQTIVFTHHHHVVDIAHNVLGANVDVIELG